MFVPECLRFYCCAETQMQSSLILISCWDLSNLTTIRSRSKASSQFPLIVRDTKDKLYASSSAVSLLTKKKLDKLWNHALVIYQKLSKINPSSLMNSLYVNGMPISTSFVYTRLVFVVCWEILILTASGKMVIFPIDLSLQTYLIHQLKIFTFVVLELEGKFLK